MKDKYVAYDASNNEYEEFPTFDEAVKWLSESQLVDGAIPQESIKGEDYIAKITHRSVYKETDSKENYHVHTDECEDNDCDLEEWPYSNEFDTVGEITMEAIDETD